MQIDMTIKAIIRSVQFGEVIEKDENKQPTGRVTPWAKVFVDEPIEKVRDDGSYHVGFSENDYAIYPDNKDDIPLIAGRILEQLKTAGKPVELVLQGGQRMMNLTQQGFNGAPDKRVSVNALVITGYEPPKQVKSA